MMDRKLSHLISLPTSELKKLKSEWKNVLLRFPGYKLAEQEIKIISRIINTRLYC